MNKILFKIFSVKQILMTKTLKDNLVRKNHSLKVKI